MQQHVLGDTRRRTEHTHQAIVSQPILFDHCYPSLDGSERITLQAFSGVAVIFPNAPIWLAAFGVDLLLIWMWGYSFFSSIPNHHSGHVLATTV